MKTNLIRRSFSILAIMLFAVLSLMSARATELIVNGNFESGTTPWTLSGASGNVISTYASLYHSATHYLWFGDDNGTDIAYQDVTIPANASTATLSFYYNINTSQTSGTPDTFSASIRNTSGSIYATVANWSNLNGTTAGSYSQMTYNLLPYAGLTVRIYFTSTCTLVGSKTTNFRVDDVSVLVTTVTCSYSLSSSGVSPSSSSGSGSFTVTTGGTCTWSAVSDSTSWLHTSSSGTGSGTVSYSYDANASTSSRIGHITVGGQTFTVTQLGVTACSYSLNSTGASPSSSAGSSSFTVTTGGGCTWSASSDATSWLHTGSSGTGSGTISYSYDANTSTSSRTGHISVGGQTFTVTQVVATSSTRQGVDYSFSRPSPSGLKAAGYDFAIRYVSPPPNSKNITLSEAQALQSAGVDIIIVFESTTNRMLSGNSAGVADANTAVNVATAAGAPQNFFCYFGNDFDTSLSDQTAINAYLDGAASVLGVQRVGFYGGYSQVKRVLDAGKAAKGWQTTAWSGGNKDSRISLYQYAYNATLPGDTSDFDKDEGYGNDLGQWSVSPPTTISIVSVSPNPSSVVAGNTFTINAAVNSSQSRTVFLGASLVPAGTTSGYINDSPHDASVTLNSGNNNVSRQFTVPAGTAAGTYDLLFAVWQDSNGNGQIDSGDTVLAGPTTVSSALTVTYVPPQYTINASAGTGGGISPNGIFSKTAGDNQAFTATPSANYVVNQWLVDSGVVQNGGTSYTLNNIQTGHSVQVTFTYVAPQYTINASAGTGGGISPNGIFSKTAGDNQAFTATPSANYVVNQWLVDSGVVQNGGTSYTLNNIQTGHSVQVTFTYVAPQYTINASAGTGGGISPNGIFSKTAGDNQAFTATPNISFIVNQWIVDSGVVQTGGTTYSLNNIQSPHSVQVTFTQAFAPKVSNPHRTGTTFTLSVPTQVGFNYTLEYKNSLSDANWTAGQMISGTGGTITLTDTGATGLSRFYHVRVQ